MKIRARGSVESGREEHLTVWRFGGEQHSHNHNGNSILSENNLSVTSNRIPVVILICPDISRPLWKAYPHPDIRKYVRNPFSAPSTTSDLVRKFLF